MSTFKNILFSIRETCILVPVFILIWISHFPFSLGISLGSYYEEINYSLDSSSSFSSSFIWLWYLIFIFILLNILVTDNLSTWLKIQIFDKTLLLGMAVRLFLDEIGIWIGGLSKVVCHPQCSGIIQSTE